MTANDSNDPSHSPSMGPYQPHRRPSWGAPPAPAGRFPDRETSREIARERVAASRTATRRMFRVTIVLIALSTGFGVVAAYQWERGKDAAANAATIAAQNDMLAARVSELESLSDGLADIVALAYADDPQQLLAELGDLEERKPAAADTTTFAKLWIGAKDRETQNQSEVQPGFETASGAAPTKAEPPPPEIAKAEPAPQDQAKGDLALNQTKGDLALNQTKGDPVQPDQTPNQTRDSQVARLEPSDANLRPSDIAIRAIAESWIQIVDGSGTPMFTKLLKDGDVHAVAPAPGALLITGNPTGLEVTVGGVAAPAFNAKGPTRREIALDPARLLDGTAEEPPKRSVAAPAPH